MLSVLHKIIRFFLIIFPIFVFGFLIFKEIVPGGKIEAVYNMRRETPFISKLYPKDRVSEIFQDAKGDYYREFFSEPVYFDIKPNDNFEKVAVTVRYKNTNGSPIKVGGLINKKDWFFDWRTLPQSGDGWENRTEIFDFSKLVPERGKYRFGFSAPGIESRQAAVSEIKIVFERKPLSEKEVVNKILDAMVWRTNRLLE